MPTPASLPRFDPFNDRTSRDVRNGLSERFVAVLTGTGPEEKLHHAAVALRRLPLAPVHAAYLDDRMARFAKALGEVPRTSPDDVDAVTRILWNLGLFFETHEYLETVWLHSSGPEKEILQALIRAAGVYVHLEQGNTRGARKMADKSLEALRCHAPALACRIGNLDDLLTALARLSPIAPELRPAAAPPNPHGTSP